MPKPKPLEGRVSVLEIESASLLSNPLGDSSRRSVTVYSPADVADSEPLPALWYLAAYSNSGAAAGNWRGFDENLLQRVERLITDGSMGPVRVVAPDCFTALGGNQYIDSAGVGRYRTFLAAEVHPAVAQAFATSWHGVFGKSSGGYGAIRLAMSDPDRWSAVASHAGDVGFDAVYRTDFPKVARTLARDGGDPNRFLERFWNARNRGADDFLTMMMLCMAVTYDPDPERPGEPRLPFDTDTVTLIDERWRAWCRHDLLALAPDHLEALRGLGALYIDCGNRDQFHLQFGTLRLHRLLDRHEVPHRYETFDGTHSGMDYRFDTSLPYLYERMEAVQ